MKPIVFIDTEVSVQTKKVADLGAIKENGDIFHSADKVKFSKFVDDCYFICGHNIIGFDYQYIKDCVGDGKHMYIDTLFLSPLIYPRKTFHNLLKNDKLYREEANNPLHDSIKARDLFYCEVESFNRLDTDLRNIYGTLLHEVNEFEGFFEYIDWNKCFNLKKSIIKYFNGLICERANISELISDYPVELGYALAIIASKSKAEIIPAWVHKNFPLIDYVMRCLRGVPCKGCSFCNQAYDIKKKFKEIYNYDSFRTFNGEKLQENAIRSAVNNESLLVVFPTGGGKSATFQLPALIQGETSKGLTVVISPLQSLMKDQVDELNRKGIINAVTINGLLNPIERKEARDAISSGKATLLYIAPESLRSKSVETLLLSRNIVRFVIDEAHCFSAWGQDFRVDYLYIASFIKKIQTLKKLNYNIPVSCFTATAKQKVIADITSYFKEKLGIVLKLYATTATRTNLHYLVEYKENDNDKYTSLRLLIKEKNCPTIVYVSRTKKAEKLAMFLNRDGIPALSYHGGMSSSQKVENQDKFLNNEVQVIVATSAFGMGINKPDVKLVVHFDISSSLEDYVQESGRAGRDVSLEADCVVFFNVTDLDKHFLLLNQTKLTFKEVSDVWNAIKKMTQHSNVINCSSVQIAKEAGLSENTKNVETKVKTAISALEEAGYLNRKLNTPRVYATSVNASNTETARSKIEESNLFDKDEIEISVQIMSHLISNKNRYLAGNEDGESRVDYIADILGKDVDLIIKCIYKLRQLKLLADDTDMVAFIKDAKYESIERKIDLFVRLEYFIVDNLKGTSTYLDLKRINKAAKEAGITKSSVNYLNSILNFWKKYDYIENTINDKESCEAKLKLSKEKIIEKIDRKQTLINYVSRYLYNKRDSNPLVAFNFSVVELMDGFNNRHDIFSVDEDTKTNLGEMFMILSYLSISDIIKIEAGFVTLFNPFEIERLNMDNRCRYKKEDYGLLKQHYLLKIQQIHIVGEFATMMTKDYNSALIYVQDYFNMEYKDFIKKYFKGDRLKEIEISTTPENYKKLFGGLSKSQLKIIEDDNSQYITVLAGPGSGKTKVLVHKLASLLMLEDIKSEQLLMLTFSRAAATEFKSRLLNLVGKGAHFVEIKTFHSYCFDLLGLHGEEEDFPLVIESAIEKIENYEVDMSKITKSVLVLDEAQDMSEQEYKLVRAIIDKNPDIRVIAVGDDDQNIYDFRGSSSIYFGLLMKNNSKVYDLLDNYRSDKSIIKLANMFSKKISTRLKQDDIVAVSDKEGSVKLVKYKTPNLIEPVVNMVEKEVKSFGKIAILTRTNEEAFNVVGLLNNRNIKCKLIQSNEHFRLYDLIEIRQLLNMFGDNTFVIENEQWENVTFEWLNKNKSNEHHYMFENMIKKFNEINDVKYFHDFVEFIRESNYEDFIDISNTNVIVSTIHKAKGHEFDCVHMLLNDCKINNDEDLRVLYVGITRAKQSLFVHYNNNVFDCYRSDFEWACDDNDYGLPNTMVLYMSHRDVNLSTFKSEKKQAKISQLFSGEKLSVNSNVFGSKRLKTKRLFKSSMKFNNQITELFNKGYCITDVSVRYIVMWRDKEDIEEFKEWQVVLPTITLRNDVEVEPQLELDVLEDENYVLDDDEVELLRSRLKSFRFRIASTNNLRPYMVFDDRTLDDILKKLPTTKEEFVNVYGLRDRKYQMFGEECINIISTFLKEIEKD